MPGVYDDERPFDYPGSSQGETFDEDKPPPGLQDPDFGEIPPEEAQAYLRSFIEREQEDEDKPWANETPLGQVIDEWAKIKHPNSTWMLTGPNTDMVVRVEGQ